MRDACAKKASRTRRAPPGRRRARAMSLRQIRKTPLLRSAARQPDRWRGRASLRLSNFVPDKIVARGSRMLERTAAKPLARRARRRKRRVTGGFAHTSLRQIRKTPLLRSAARQPDVGGDCWAHPWAQPFRAARSRASLRLSNFVPDKIVEPKRFRPHLSLRQIRKTPLSGRFAYLAEREGFEPSIRLLTLYSLSRGAPSASRASLRVFAALLRSRQGY